MPFFPNFLKPIRCIWRFPQFELARCVNHKICNNVNEKWCVLVSVKVLSVYSVTTKLHRQYNSTVTFPPFSTTELQLSALALFFWLRKQTRHQQRGKTSHLIPHSLLCSVFLSLPENVHNSLASFHVRLKELQELRIPSKQHRWLSPSLVRRRWG